jgi:HSP20 family protein|tara:strand:+ start:1039 stop:1506 length:468 start_codon:yes stop_codon:yes gene_type:complete
MSLFKHQPLSTMPQLPIFSQLSDEMNHFFGRDLPMFGRQPELLSSEWQPATDIEQRDNRYIIKADIPGVDPKDIKVTMENGNLIIEGKRETKVEENKKNYHRIERSFGSFYRCIDLPDASEESKKIEAHCNKGVLEIIVPKIGAAAHKKIEIKVD